MKKFNTAAIFAKRTEPMGPALNRLLPILKKAGVSYFLEETTASHIPGAVGYDLPHLGEIADVIIILGGDGTTLGIARRMAQFNLPIIAINVGRLGFITDLTLDDMDCGLPPLLAGDYQTDTRSLLCAKLYRKGELLWEKTAVNDAGITHGMKGSMVEFNVWVNGKPMARQRADGIIVASATGSTAYALAAGGPILHPGLDAMVLVPVAPHTLTNRPIVLPSSQTIELELIEARNASAYCDMQDFHDMCPGDRLCITTSQESYTMLHSLKHNHYATLREKLHWNRMPTDKEES